MKKIVFTILSLFLVCQSYAQMSVKMGDFKYKITNYRGAANSYSNYLNDSENQYNVEVLRKLANAYLKSNQNDLAEKTLAKLTILDTSFLDIIAYAEVLMKNKKYDELNKFISTKPELANRNNLRLNNVVNTVKHVDQLESLDTGNIRISKLNFNNNNSDFSPTFFQNGIIFSSNRVSNGFFKSKKTKLNKNIMGLYFSNSENGFKEVKAIATNLKSKGNYGNAQYHAKSKTLYYVVNAKPKSAESANKDISINLAHYDYVNDKWVKGFYFPFNSPKYSNTTPFVIQEGTHLYFSSNMPGGYGGFDIYVSYWKDSSWTIPHNMGALVNSTGDELYPFVDHANIFYFASNGRGGLGGLDIFSYDLSNLSAPSENLAAPFNSNSDDFGYIVSPNLTNGYFNSGRASNGADCDLYSFSRLKPTITNIRVNIVDAKSSGYILNAKLLMQMDSNLAAFSSLNGTKSIENVKPGKKIIFVASASNYDTVKLEVLVNRMDTLFEMRLTKLQQGCSLAGKVTNKRTGERLINAKISIVNTKDSNDKYEFYTNSKGEYAVNGLRKSNNYNINVALGDYFSSYKNINIQSANNTNENSIDEIQDFKLISSNTVKIDSIYFDFNKSNIRSDAAIELDKIVSFMKDNPEIIIELYSHTDSRGTDKVNNYLSQRRAINSVRYITSKGISKKRITGKGFGASQLLNSCTAGVECTEEEHQINRRTEMKVMKILAE